MSGERGIETFTSYFYLPTKNNIIIDPATNSRKESLFQPTSSGLLRVWHCDYFLGWILLKRWEILPLPTFISTKFSVLVAFLIELLEDFIVLTSEVKYLLLVSFCSF